MPTKRKELPLKPCEACGAIIPKETNRNWNQYALKRYCSRECSARSKSQKVVACCTTCGKVIERSPAHARGTIYCSHDCRRKKREYTCEICAKTFTRCPSHRQGKHIYCSMTCQGIAKRVIKPTLTCDFCGDEFERYPSELTKAEERGYTFTFCSHSCRAAMIAAQFNPPKPYTKPHTSALRNGTKMIKWRKAVKERDGYICTQCGATDKMLNVHHVKPFAIYPDLRYEVSNGVTLCYECHEQLHSLQ